MVNTATGSERHFKQMVQDCVKTLRVNKDQKHNLIKLLNEDFKQQFTQRITQQPSQSPPTFRKMNSI